jgi:hypothetical protein
VLLSDSDRVLLVLYCKLDYRGSVTLISVQAVGCSTSSSCSSSTSGSTSSSISGNTSCGISNITNKVLI